MRTPTSLLRLLSLSVALLFFAAPPAQAYYERAELEQMLAPIALYPDSVLSHVLIAATYPDQVAEAAQWSRRHPDLQGEAAVDAVDEFDWDASVKALAAFPEVLARMDEDPDWTDQLGEAFLDQEGDVMDAVQHLRTRAYEAGRLGSLDNVRVVREREYIYIEPAVRGVIFVPYYDPWWVYGSWWWPYYPPYCWTTWYGRPVSYYGSSWYWGIGFHVRPAFYFTTFHWPARHVVVTHHYNRPLYSGRDVPRHQDVRHWRQEPSARRHADRTPGAERREQRGDERRSERRVDRHEDRRNDRPGARSDERRRGERQDRRREPAAASHPERRDETRSDGRRERMERGRQQRDAEREEPPGRARRETGGERGQPDRRQSGQNNEAPVRREDSQAPRGGAQNRREDSQERREETQDRGDAAPGRRHETQGDREEVRDERDPDGRAQGRQNRDKRERGRAQREDRSGR